jgi:hypothetical protein
MIQLEVERHKMYEHPVPVSPFEERRFASDTLKNNSKTSEQGDLLKMTSDVTTTTNGKSNSNNMTTIDGGQMRKVPIKLFRS